MVLQSGDLKAWAQQVFTKTQLVNNRPKCLFSNLDKLLNLKYKPKMVKLCLISEWSKLFSQSMEQLSKSIPSDKRLWTTSSTLLSKEKEFQMVKLVPVPILADKEFSSKSAAPVSLLPEETKVTSGTHVLTNHWLLLT